MHRSSLTCLLLPDVEHHVVRAHRLITAFKAVDIHNVSGMHLKQPSIFAFAC
jgi:hypothetical protein